ncbi:sigma-70 family RNA polymerase sigma factor [Altererythrobacter sp.]|nr:sigma-70 family RNA polymerase sigma factor [Altererythrobacter sp.]
MTDREDQEKLYQEAGDQFSAPIARLARALERDPERSRDLEQDIHCAIWRSLPRFNGACSLKTWVFRVAHNTAADFVAAASKRPKAVPLDEIESLPEASDVERATAESHAIARVMELIRSLAPLDAQIILLWLEGQSGAEMAEITGLTPNAAQLRVHRIKALITQSFTPANKEGKKNG